MKMKLFRSSRTKYKEITAYDRDEKLARASEPLPELVEWAIRTFGMSPFTLAREIWDLYRGPGHLLPKDYFFFKLCATKGDLPQKMRFLSDTRQAYLIKASCDPKWEALTEDKWACYSYLTAHGIRVPKTLAVIDKSVRSFGKTLKIGSGEEFENFIDQIDVCPIFVKANSGVASLGAFVVKGSEKGRIYLENADSIDVNELFDRLIGSRTFLVQSVVRNHPELRSFSPHLATVRTINLVKTNAIFTPFTLLKIPTAMNIADNYWRPGNMLADVDPENGVIRRVVRGRGRSLEELIHHPETGTKLVGLTLPYWQELRNVNDTCARLYAPVRFNTLDIALTEEGPVVIEVNTGGAFSLPQYATGDGFLTDEVIRFFESCGYKF
jgi:Sugar-transfer associated ATP-grasp